MEFNITLTKEDIYKAQALRSKNVRNKNIFIYIMYTLFMMVYLVTFALIGVLIVSLISSDTSEHIIYAYAISSAISLIIMLLVATVLNKYSRYNSEVIITDTHKYTISEDTIKDETEYSIVETKIKGIKSCLENDKFYLMETPHQVWYFPKREIDKLAEKEELIRWLNIIKKETEQLALAKRSKHYRRFWSVRNRISPVCRKMFIEDSSSRSKDDTTNNNKGE
jgi:hypothetical protein